MSSRPTWQGHLKLSLVSCPVALYAATSGSSDVRFHLINPKTNNRIRMIATDPDAGPVERGDLVKGYEFEKGRYILLTDEEIRSVRLESTKTIDIEQFVPAENIDRLYWNDPYFLVPDGKMAVEAYSVIREAMKKSGQIALGRVVMATRERMVALETRDRGIIAYTLRAENEVADAEAAFKDIPAVKADPNMVSIALKIIEQKEGPFDPAKFVDRYEQALKALIAEKEKGQKPVAAEPPEDTNVVDLMAALRASLKREGPQNTRTEPRAKAAPAKPTPARRKAR
ncbi:MAG: Ku protein [Rhodospirillales bacterium]